MNRATGVAGGKSHNHRDGKPEASDLSPSAVLLARDMGLDPEGLDPQQREVLGRLDSNTWIEVGLMTLGLAFVVAAVACVFLVSLRVAVVAAITGVLLFVINGFVGVWIYNRGLMDIRLRRSPSLWRDLSARPNDRCGLPKKADALAPALMACAEHSADEVVGWASSMGGSEVTSASTPVLASEFACFYLSAVELVGRQVLGEKGASAFARMVLERLGCRIAAEIAAGDTDRR